MAKTGSVIENVLRKITPSDSVRKKTGRALSKIENATGKAVKEEGLTYTLAGSYLRDTWLKDKKEFDIFILFPESVSRENLEKRGMSIGKSIVKTLNGSYEIAYAEHPYIRALVDGYAVDFVPCYDIKDASKIKSAVDRTPHHNKFIVKSLTPALSSEVRLLKQFCKSIGVYGSDLRVEGFSGYLSELLIVRYRSFLNTVSEASKWEAGKVFIDLGKHHEEMPDTGKRYPNQPLIVIDPVDRNRNVAAALSPANFEKFKESAKSFLKKPDEKYFRLGKAKVNVNGLSRDAKKRNTRLLSVMFPRPDAVDDVLYPQMRKSAKRVKAILEDADFRIIGHDVWCDSKNCLLFLELEVWSLPKIRKVIGPPTFSKKHSEEFNRKYKGQGRIWVEGSNLVTEVKRKYTDAGSLLEEELSASEKKLRDSGIASHIAKYMKKKEILTDSAVIQKAESNNELAFFLSDYFKNKVL